MRKTAFASTVLLCLSWAFAPVAAGRVFDAELSARDIETMKRNVQYVMSLSVEEMLDIVPAQSGIYFTDCPNCDTGAQDRANWEWRPEQPGRLKCRGCGAEYPDNPDYPDGQYIAVRAPEGEHRYYYYEKPDGYRIFFRATADYWARDYMAKACRDLGTLYAATGEEEYAERAAAILLRFAEVFPGWAYTNDLPYRQKRFSPYDQNRIPGVVGHRNSRWSWWAYMDISEDLLRGYDALKQWPGLDALADGQGRRRIEQDLFDTMVTFVVEIEEPYTNMSPTAWRGFIYAGRVLERPEWVAEALDRVAVFLEGQFLYDGHWFETAPSYSLQVEGSLRRIVRSLGNYEPPADADAALAGHIRETLESVHRSIAMLQEVNRNLWMPDGMPPPVNDTWARRRGSPPADVQPLLMPGLGLAILRGGEGDGQFYAWLNFTQGRHHKHLDVLDIGLFALGAELLRDIGYTHTAWRSWTRHTMSHNTVVVDGRNSGVDRWHRDTRLRGFATDGSGFALAEAESDAAYPGTASRYRRTLAAVGADGRDLYLVDVFQVRGGSQHDFLLHGSAAEDSTATMGGTGLEPYAGTLLNPGVEFQFPRGETQGREPDVGYGYVRNLKHGAAGTQQGRGLVTLDVRLSSNPDTGYRSWLTFDGPAEAYLGEAPRIRQAERRDDTLHDFFAPFFCLRRQGEDLDSLFVAVHEPVEGEPKVVSVQAETHEESGALLLTVDRGPLGRDYFAMALEGPADVRFATPDGELRFGDGWGLVRTSGGQPVSATLVGGEALELGAAKASGAGGWRGEVAGTFRGQTEAGGRGWFDVAERIAPDAGRGALILRFEDGTARGYNVVAAEATNAGTRLHVAEDPGFEAEGGKIQIRSFPQRAIEGARVEYRLPGVARWAK